MFIHFFFFLDNPLICDCDLRWYRDWLKELRHKDDDDIIQKKHILCLMESEHRFRWSLLFLFFFFKLKSNTSTLYEIKRRVRKTETRMVYIRKDKKKRLAHFKNNWKINSFVHTPTLVWIFVVGENILLHFKPTKQHYFFLNCFLFFFFLLTIKCCYKKISMILNSNSVGKNEK